MKIHRPSGHAWDASSCCDGFGSDRGGCCKICGARDCKCGCCKICGARDCKCGCSDRGGCCKICGAWDCKCGCSGRDNCCKDCGEREDDRDRPDRDDCRKGCWDREDDRDRPDRENRCRICGERESECDCDMRPYPPCVPESPTISPFTRAYAELYSTTNASVVAGAFLPLTQSNASEGVLLNQSEGTMTIEVSGVYLVNYGVSAAETGTSFALNIDGNTAPNTTINSTVADLLISGTRLLPLYAGQTIGITALENLTLSAATTSVNASLVITKIDTFC